MQRSHEIRYDIVANYFSLKTTNLYHKPVTRVYYGIEWSDKRGQISSLAGQMGTNGKFFGIS
uniref:Uncharacterized protein n=1 Tax=Romanomermis culicivorax TaxID=13658 RepID=A0A915JN44_ROMCU